MIEVQIIADSISERDVRITSFLITMPRFILSELLTHRVFSRNTASSRAIPIKRMLESVATTPALPIHWGQNRKGMQAKDELKGVRKGIVKTLWWMHRWFTLSTVWMLEKAGLHKQLANRLLEPHAHVTVLVTSTMWQNFLHLRNHKDAMPEIEYVAKQIKQWLEVHDPRLLKKGDWHLPFISSADYEDTYVIIDPHTMRVKLRLISAARCARTSYTLFSSQNRSCLDDYNLGERIIKSDPIHASPLEHQATPDPLEESPHLWGNFHGWIQHRKMYKNEAIHEQPNTEASTANGSDALIVY